MNHATIAIMRRHPLPSLILAALLPGLASCENPLKQRDYLGRHVAPEETQRIEAKSLADQSRTPPVSVDQAADDAVRKIVQPATAPASLDLALADVRAAALEHNLDLQVEVFNPAIAQYDVDAERAKFESTFNFSARRAITDSPTDVATEGSQVKRNDFDLGVNVPLRTGGTVNVDLPFADTKTNNPFSLLNPSYDAALRFSISQPLLRNAGVNVNTHSIRVAEYQQTITSARTKLEAIRILADADKAYWRLYAARRILEVRQKQYELAVSQLEQAQRRVSAGELAQIEVTRAKSGVASSLQDIIIAQTAIRRGQRDLKRIMNRPDMPINSPTELVTVTEPDPRSLDLDPDALATFALDNRMEMLELELQLAIDASTVDFRRNQKLPLVTLDYTYGINGLGSTYGRAFDQLLPDRSFEDHIVGLNVSVPLGNEQAEAFYRQAILTRLQRLATREQRNASIRQEVFDALDGLLENWQRILAARQESIFAGATYEAEKRQFDVGVRTSTDVQDALARLADAQSREIQALANYEISQVDIAFATGTLLGQDQIRWEPKYGEPIESAH